MERQVEDAAGATFAGNWPPPCVTDAKETTTSNGTEQELDKAETERENCTLFTKSLG